MLSEIIVKVNGIPVLVPSGATVTTAILIAGKPCRTSVSGEPRGPICGMGICFECRVSINGNPHCRSCQTLCEQGMEVTTDE